MRARHTLGVAAIVAMTAVAVTSCGSAETPEVTHVARQFADAVAAHRGAAACSYLAPSTKSALVQSEGKPCSAALLKEHLPQAGAIRSATAYGTMAQVKLARDTLFLSRFNQGWRVTAAGCSPQKDRPYNCTLQGG